MITNHVSGVSMKLCGKVRRAIAFAATCVVLTAAGGFFPIGAHAGPTYAVVDLDKAYQQSKEKTVQDASLQAYAKALQTAYQGQQQAIMLSREQQEALGKLLIKDVLSDADKAAFKKMMDSSKSDYDKLTALQQKQEKNETLTDQDKLDYQTLAAQAHAGQQTLSEINQAYQQQWEQRNQEAREEVNAKIKEAVTIVAQKQGIQVVFSSQAAVYAATDITKDVVAVINK